MPFRTRTARQAMSDRRSGMDASSSGQPSKQDEYFERKFGDDTQANSQNNSKSRSSFFKGTTSFKSNPFSFFSENNRKNQQAKQTKAEDVSELKNKKPDIIEQLVSTIENCRKSNDYDNAKLAFNKLKDIADNSIRARQELVSIWKDFVGEERYKRFIPKGVDPTQNYVLCTLSLSNWEQDQANMRTRPSTEHASDQPEPSLTPQPKSCRQETAAALRAIHGDAKTLHHSLNNKPVASN